ncbi:MAG: hypothetical protein LBU65_13210 [Planctomycetaceae bacterium]|jgi:hypothetical protein|nr:hypothetical protein [Planctomycetaceae bacterium]
MYKIFIPVCLCLVFVCGCSSSNPQGRLAIEGEVTIGGKPVNGGSIEFEPVGSQTERTQSGSTITNGKYSIPAQQGLVAGDYKVRITVMEEVPGSRVDDPDPMKSKVEYRDIAPSNFGSASEQEVTVTKSGKQVFNFAM